MQAKGNGCFPAEGSYARIAAERRPKEAGVSLSNRIPRRGETIRAWKESGGRVASVLPIHYPRALLRAFGFLPVEVWGPPGIDAARAGAHLPAYVCSVVRNALAFLLAGGLEEADVIVVPHACDSLQGLGSILLDFARPKQPILPLYFPRGEREADTAFLASELRAACAALERITGCAPSDSKLRACIEAEESADRLLRWVSERRACLGLRDLELYRLMRSREFLPAETFSALAQSALDQAGGPVRQGTPILLSGIVPEPTSLFESLAQMGGRVASDDLACCGRRLYPPGVSSDPYRRMAESLLGAAPDAMRGSPIQARLENLLRLCGASGARGVVFYDVKFCEPELFDIPELRRGLQDAGIPSIAIEVDLSDALSQQTLTRIEAFLEMIA
jgi:benzoyl-CoA reductase/2-hydroxyglutaryl-CoA dehydratase subunit BcrC/BadD/HgdB